MPGLLVVRATRPGSRQRARRSPRPARRNGGSNRHGSNTLGLLRSRQCLADRGKVRGGFGSVRRVFFTISLRSLPQKQGGRFAERADPEKPTPAPGVQELNPLTMTAGLRPRRCRSYRANSSVHVAVYVAEA